VKKFSGASPGILIFAAVLIVHDQQTEDKEKKPGQDYYDPDQSFDCDYYFRNKDPDGINAYSTEYKPDDDRDNSHFVHIFSQVLFFRESSI